MIEDDAPRPRPADRPTTMDRAADQDDDVHEIAITTKKPAATASAHEPTSKLSQMFGEHPKVCDLGHDTKPPALIDKSPPDKSLGEIVAAQLMCSLSLRDPRLRDDDPPVPITRDAEAPALLTQALHVPVVPDDGVPGAPSLRGSTEPVDIAEGGMSRAAVSLMNGASWLASCGHEHLAALVMGMGKCLSTTVTNAKPLEFVGARLTADLLRAGAPFGEEEIGTMLVQVARDVGVDPCSRTMRKIAKDYEAKAAKYEDLASKAHTSGNMFEKNEWLVRADELRARARDLKKATR